MRRPLLAFVGLIAAGGTAAGVYVALPSGGEEEILQQVPTATPVASASVIATPTPPLSVELDDYRDPATGVSVSYPKGNTLEERQIELPGKDGIPSATARQVIFWDDAHVPTISIAFSPNPADLDLETWIKAIPGWPAEPKETTVDGIRALLFDVDPTDTANPTVYLKQGSEIIGIRGNVAGGEGSPGGLSYDDFLVIIETVKVP